MPSADLSQLTAVISTADRPQSLARLVGSLRRGQPQLRILVADAGLQPKTPRGVDSVRLPASVGRSACYNALLARLRTPYFLLLEDRCELLPETQLLPLLQLVAGDRLDLAAGDLLSCERKAWLFTKRSPQPAHGLLQFAGDQLTLEQGHRSAGEGFLWCDVVHNFFVASTSKVRAMGGWDPELHNNEREEFFVRAHRRGLRVGLVPQVTALLWKQRPSKGSQDSAPDLKSLAVAKMGLLRMTDFDGRITKAPRRAQAA